MVAAIDFPVGAWGCDHDPDFLLPWQGGGGGPDIQIPCGMELCVATTMCLLRGMWEAGPSCDEEGELEWWAFRLQAFRDLCYLCTLTPPPTHVVPTAGTQYCVPMKVTRRNKKRDRNVPPPSH